MDCGCETKADPAGQRKVLLIALGLNATMFFVGIIAGLAAQSTGLIADSLDMFADAASYGIALSASSRGASFKAKAARLSGAMLLVLGIGVLVDVLGRSVAGSTPVSGIMMGVASISLLVNATVLYLLGKHRDDGVHLRATWIFTRTDVIANAAVIASGLIILLTGFRIADLVVGGAIGIYIIREALEILREARNAVEAG